MLALAVSFLAIFPSAAATLSLNPEADTFVRRGINQTVNYGTVTNLDIYQNSTTRAYFAYVRFNLSVLPPGAVITNATLTFTYNGGGTRTDTLTTGRFATYGLLDMSGNTPQNWGETTLTGDTIGAEFIGIAAVDIDTSTRTVSFDGVGESISGGGGVGSTASVTGSTGGPLVSFLNARFGAGGLATFIVDFPGTESGRGYALGSREATSGQPVLVVNYFVPPTTPPPLRWATGSGDWDINLTPNWFDPASNPTNYVEVSGVGNPVLFEDAVSGTPPIVVTLDVTVAPAAVTNSGGKDYTFNGSGGIAGAGNFVKSGSGTLTVNLANSFTGGVEINGGTVVVGHSNALGATIGTFSLAAGTVDLNGNNLFIGGLGGSGTITDNAPTPGTSLLFTEVNATRIFSGIVGDGPTRTLAFTKSGSGTLALSGANNYDGDTTVNAGTLRLDAGGVIAGAAANIGAGTGAQLHLNGGSLSATSGSVGSGGGTLRVDSGTATFSGAISAALGASSDHFIHITGGTLSAESLTLGRLGSWFTTEPTAGYNNRGLYINGGTVNLSGDLNMCSASAANSTVNARLDNGSLTVGGVATIGLNNSGRWSVLDVNGGVLTVNNTATGISVGGPFEGRALFLMRGGTATVGKITLGQGAVVSESVLRLNGGTLYLGSGGIVLGSSGLGHVATVHLGGGTLGAAADWSTSLPISLGTATIKAADGTDTARNITLNGALSGGSLTKTGAGELRLNGANTHTGVTSVDAGILSGTGSLAGPVSVNAGGTLAPGAGGLGTLTINNNLTLGGTLALDVNKAGLTLTSDLVAGIATLACGGAVTVSATGDPLTAGDEFTVLSAATFTGAFTGITPAPGAGLAWDISKLATEGKLLVHANPVANPDTAAAVHGTTNSIALTKLLANDIGETGETLTITAVTSPTPGGGTATLGGGLITYIAPTSGATDTISYTLSDGRGGTATGTVNVTLVPTTAPSLNVVTGPTLVDNQFQVTFAGIPGYTYTVEDSTVSVTGPWNFLTNLTAGSNGLFQLIVTNDPPATLRFFRTTAP